MFVEPIKSNKGSTLIMLLMVISVLTILGTVLITVSLVNVKTKIIDGKAKTAHYLAEAGLDEAYAIIAEEVDKAIESGNTLIENEVMNKLHIIKNYLIESVDDEGNIDEILLKSLINSDTDLTEEIKKPLFDSDGNISKNYKKLIIRDESKNFGTYNEEVLKTLVDSWFRQEYKRYIENDINNNVLKARLESESNYEIVDSEINSSRPAIEVIKLDSFGTSDEIELILTSEFLHDKILKKVRTSYQVGVPNYNEPYFIENQVVKLEKNVLWDYAIITEKNIYITENKDNNVVIDGDIYAYGTQPSNNRDSRDYGGLVVGNDSKSGRVTINGTVITNSYIHTNESKSNITINGDAYCNSLVVQNGTNNSSINVIDGQVNTKDDIELNGTKATINIEGCYFGFSDGTESHDKSSSIVINSDDIGDEGGSSITITGASSDNQGIYIGGTVYIGADDNYQTGESVSIKGNYISYTHRFNDLTGDDSKYNSDNILFKNIPPLVLADKLIKEDGEEKRRDLIFIDKNNYIYNYYLDEENRSNLNLGGAGVNIDEGNIVYSIGTYITSGKMEKDKFNHDNESIGIIKANEYNYFVNKLGDSQITYEVNEAEIDSSLLSRLEIQDRFSFTNGEAYTNPQLEDVNNTGEIIYINDNESRALVIIGPEGTTPSGLSESDIYRINDLNLKGIIVTSGDVYLTGKLKYTGTIVAEGNIYILDDKEKNILHDKIYIQRKIVEIENLKNKFINRGISNVQESSFLYKDDVGVADVDSNKKQKELIKIKSWHLLR